MYFNFAQHGYLNVFVFIFFAGGLVLFSFCYNYSTTTCDYPTGYPGCAVSCKVLKRNRMCIILAVTDNSNAGNISWRQQNSQPLRSCMASYLPVRPVLSSSCRLNQLCPAHAVPRPANWLFACCMACRNAFTPHSLHINGAATISMWTHKSQSREMPFECNSSSLVAAYVYICVCVCLCLWLTDLQFAAV